MRLRSLSGFVSMFLLSLLLVSCLKEESVESNLPTAPGSGGTSVYALSTSGGDCMNDSVQGIYKKGTALNATNKVRIEVSVNTPGTWNVNTAAITGFYFSGSGSFTTAGTQTITLNGSGTPTTTGTQTFTLIVGSSTCTFDVTVDSTGTTPTPNPTGDYFPMTQASWWSYDDGTGDTVKTVVSGTRTIGANTYTRFVDSYESSPGDTDTALYRKSGSDYYLYQDLSDFSSLGVTFANPTADVLFLKSVLTTNATWNTDVPGTIGGNNITIRFAFKCIDANLSTTVNGRNFTNVYHVQMNVKMGTGAIFTDVEGPFNLYFAPGVGLIKGDDGTSGGNTIRYWQVN